MSQQVPRGYSIPTIDLSDQRHRHVVVAQGTEDVYQGHPTTVLMGDGRTMYAVWTYGHGGACGPLKRSDDGGLTWSDLLPVPENWSPAYNCPSIYRLTDPAGVERLMVFAAGAEGDRTMQQSVSEDGGRTWTPYQSLGFRCVMAFTTVVPISGGRYLALYHCRDADENLPPITVWQTISADGGLTWSERRLVGQKEGADPCEPWIVRSPDGRQLLCLMRENSRTLNSLMMTSDDEGETWSPLTELPGALTGDRHAAAYAPDGRLVVTFRDRCHDTQTFGQFIAWVGTYDDIIAGREGQYRVKLLHSHGDHDCGYPGLEVLPDGTFVATTYIKYNPGPEKHSVVSVRFTLAELDAAAESARR